MNKRFIAIRKFIFNKNTAIFIPAIFIAALFWLLTALTRTYNGTLEFPIKYINPPKDKVVISPLPEKITFSVRTSGWEILSNSFQKNQFPIVINIEALRNKSFLVTGQNMGIFTEHVPPEMVIYKLSPDTIYFEFDETQMIRVPIRFNADLTYKKQYNLGEKISIFPDSVSLTGPLSIIKLKKYWNTEKLVKGEINKSIRQKIKLAEPDNNLITLSEKEVEVSIPVEEFTEGNVEIPIEIINQKKNIQVVIFPKSVKIYYNVSLKKYQMVKPHLFEASVDLSGIDIFAVNMAEVKITHHPSFANVLNHSPNMVEFIIYK